MQPGFVSVTLCARSEYQNSVPCPEIMKDYNSDNGSIDLIDKKTAAYKLGYKSERRFHL